VPKLIHAMIRVVDLDKSLRFYRDVLGLEESHLLDYPDFSLVYLRDPSSGFEIELTLNKGHSEAYTHGDGYGHIAAVVPNVQATRQALIAAGYAPNPIKEFKQGEELVARFFFIQDPDGYKIEVLEKHGHYR
jgi:lactoylglutathione lyase